MAYDKSLEGKKAFFKSLAIPEVVHLVMIIIWILNTVIEKLNKIQKNLLWYNRKVKIKQNILCHDYKDDALKSVGVEHKIASLNWSWVKRLYSESFH